MADGPVLVLIGAFVGGLVSGLTGFGTGLRALPFWIHAMPPILARPLIVVCSIVSQLHVRYAPRHPARTHHLFE